MAAGASDAAAADASGFVAWWSVASVVVRVATNPPARTITRPIAIFRPGRLPRGVRTAAPGAGARGIRVVVTVLTSRGVGCEHHRPGSLRSGCALVDWDGDVASLAVRRRAGPRSRPWSGGLHGRVPGQRVCNRFATGRGDGSAMTGGSDDRATRGGRGRRLLAMVAGGATGDPVGTWTVLFTDQVGSTAMRVRVGEEVYDGIRVDLDARVTAALAAHGVGVTKSTGDGVTAGFTSTAAALRCAVAIQQAVALRNGTTSEGAGAEAVALRIGISVGRWSKGTPRARATARSGDLGGFGRRAHRRGVGQPPTSHRGADGARLPGAAPPNARARSSRRRGEHDARDGWSWLRAAARCRTTGRWHSSPALPRRLGATRTEPR